MKINDQNNVTDQVEPKQFEIAPSFRAPLFDADGKPVMEQVRDEAGNPAFETEPVLDENGEPVLDENNKPTYRDVLDDNGERIPVMKQKTGVPEGITVDEKTGVVTIPDTYQPAAGDEPFVVPVRVVYEDDSIDMAEVTFRPKVDLSKVFEPDYKDKLVTPGKDATSAPQFTKDGKNVPVPQGTKFATPEDFTAPAGYTVEVDPNTGVVTAKVDPNYDEAANGPRDKEFTVPVEVTYRDGTKEQAEAVFKLDSDGDGIADADDKDKTQVEFNQDEIDANPIKPIDEDQNTGIRIIDEDTDTDVTATDPDGNPVKVDVDPKTGEVTVNPAKDPAGNDKDPKGPITVTITDPDLVTNDNPDDKVEIKVPVSEKVTTVAVPETITPLKPKDNKDQGTGIKIFNPNPDGSTKVTAKDEDGQDVKVVVDPNTGEIKVNPTKNPDDKDIKVDGPVTVTVEDSDLPGGKQTIEVPVDGHAEGEDDNDNGTPEAPNTDIKVEGKPKSVVIGGGDQKTNVKVVNKTDDTTVSGVDEDGNTIKVVIDGKGNIVVNPDVDADGKQISVDGPITVTVKDSKLPGGEKTFDVPVRDAKTGGKHQKGEDDNGNGTPTSTTTVTQPAETPSVTEGQGNQETGVTVTYPESEKPTVKATDEDGNSVSVEIDDNGQLKVNPVDVKDAEGNPAKVDGPIKVVITDSEGNETEVTVDVIGKNGKKHTEGKDDNGNGQPASEDDTKYTDVTIGKIENPTGDETIDVDLKDQNGNPITEDDVQVRIDEDGNIIIRVPEGTEVKIGEDGRVELKFPDGREATGTITVRGKDGKSKATINVGEGDPDDNTGQTGATKFVPSTDKPVIADGQSRTVGKLENAKGGEQAKIVDKDGKEIEGATVTIDKNGNVTVTVKEGTQPTNSARLQITRGTETIYDGAIRIIEGVNVGKCAAAATGFGLPLLALIPLGFALTVGIPGLETQVQQVSPKIEAANTALQQQLGIFNPEMAAQAAEINAQLKQFGLNLVTGIGVVVLVPLMLANIVGIAASCSPGGSSEFFGSSDR